MTQPPPRNMSHKVAKNAMSGGGRRGRKPPQKAAAITTAPAPGPTCTRLVASVATPCQAPSHPVPSLWFARPHLPKRGWLVQTDSRVVCARPGLDQTVAQDSGSRRGRQSRVRVGAHQERPRTDNPDRGAHWRWGRPHPTHRQAVPPPRPPLHRFATDGETRTRAPPRWGPLRRRLCRAPPVPSNAVRAHRGPKQDGGRDPRHPRTASLAGTRRVGLAARSPFLPACHRTCCSVWASQWPQGGRGAATAQPAPPRGRQ